MPTPEELRTAHAVFERIESRGVFYPIALRLVDFVFGGRSDLTSAEAVSVLLQTSNQAFYRYHRFDEHHVADLEVLLESFREGVTSYTNRAVEELTGEDETPVKETFAAFEALLGPVGTAKCPHLLAPRFFPLWDRAIATGHGLSLVRTGRNAAKYWRFMQITKEHVRRLAGNIPDGNPLKVLDEYNYCV